MGQMSTLSVHKKLLNNDYDDTRHKIFLRKLVVPKARPWIFKLFLKFWKSRFRKKKSNYDFVKNEWHRSKKWLRKFFWSQFFWSESIQNGPKCILEWKSRFRKKCSPYDFFPGQSHFFEKMEVIYRKNGYDKRF